MYRISSLPLRQFSGWLLLTILVAGLLGCKKEEREKKILVFSKTTGFRHASIPDGATALVKLGKESGFAVDTTEDATRFTDQNLKQYSAVVFLSTTGNVLDFNQQAAFERYVQAGGGFVGIHAATDTEYNWPWYNKLVGAYFESHPEQQKANVRVVNKNHVSTKHLPDVWSRFDEWYNFKSLNPDVTVLANLDEKSYKGGKNGANHPAAWYHEYDGGRAFYTAGGHTNESFKEPEFIKHLLGGIQWAMGEGKEPNYNKAKTAAVPEQNRFTKTVLAENFDEPMELAVDNKGNVFFVERKGKVKMYNPTTGKVDVIGEIPVSTKYTNGKEAEDGLLGIALAPGFESNRWMYLFYSPAGSAPKQNISRFTLTKEYKIDPSSEKIVIEIATQRDQCCHSAGSLAFDRQGNLFIAAGDNTNPFESSGYSPTDERPDRSPWDAQKSSANMNDLRGKVSRIHPEPDGSYTIPEGNLFPKDGSQGRPEIYAMGMRNPYRIAIDDKRYYLYWGDIGPDAGKDSLQGPKGHDEVNQAKKPGYFGWPYFVGNNKPYNKVNFATNEIGAPHNPKAPKNTSPHNTGGTNLPPAQPAFIWYPYDESKEFPDVGKGGRSAMAGPTYYTEDFPKDSPVKFPEYYDEALLTYEWMRGWMMAVRLDEKGDFMRMEPVASHIKMEKPTDMQFGPDGALYVLEYGTNWFAPNDDSKLIKIEYVRGNRPPVVIAKADNKIGATPLKVKFSSTGTRDDDGDKLSYDWRFADEKINSNEKNPEFTFDKPGVYQASLTVTDDKGRSATSNVEIQVGNSVPVVAVKTNGNNSFYWDNQSVDYRVDVRDKEDGTLLNGGADPSRLKVYVDYLPEGKDLIQVLGHQTKDAEEIPRGLALINGSDCKACHGINKKSIGPAYVDVAKKYENDEGAVARLTSKVIKGGGGVWGENVMSAHPQLPAGDVTEMVQYILTLAKEGEAKNSLDPQGSFTAEKHVGKGEEGSYVVSAYYTDKGAKAVGSLTGNTMLVLRHPKIQAEDFDSLRSATKMKFGDVGLASISNNGYISFRNIDLTGINKLTYNYFSQGASGKIEARIDSPDGKVVGTTNVTPSDMSNMQNIKPSEVSVQLGGASGKHNLFFVFKADPGQEGTLHVDWIYFHNPQMPDKKPASALTMK